LRNLGTLHDKYWASAGADSTSSHNTGTTAHTAANIRAHDCAADFAAHTIASPRVMQAAT